jgi:hypothetical protein
MRPDQKFCSQAIGTAQLVFSWLRFRGLLRQSFGCATLSLRRLSDREFADQYCRTATHEASQPTDPGRGVSVADNDDGAKDGQAGETDIAHSVFFHAHDSRITNPAARCAPCRRKQAKLGDSGVMAATRKGTDDAEFKLLQFFFAPAHRSRTDTHTAHGADGALA